MAGEKWTPQEEEILRTMLEAGKSGEAVLQVLKSRTSNSIQKKAAELGLSLHGPVEIDFEAYRKIMGKMENPEWV